MSTPSNAVPEFSNDSQGIAPAALSSTRPLYWSIRRELWENRSLYIAPLAAAAVVLFGFLISAVLDPAQRRHALAQQYDFAAGLLMATQILVGVFYCLDALHGERRDRSILFWKSLPVSDLTTVLSKALIPIFLLPLFTFAITVATHLIMLLVSGVVRLGIGLTVTTLWTQGSLFQMSLGLLYHLLALHVLWHAPIYAWLLLVSGWARRAVFLWAVLPVLAICGVEKIAFNTAYFAVMLGHRFTGPEAFTAPGSATMSPMMTHVPDSLLSTPGLWIGLLFAAACLAAAVRLRRYREPI